MTTIGVKRPAARTVGRPFYLIMSLLMAAVFVGGFSQTVPGDFVATPGLPMLLDVHGAIFTLWVVVFVSQPAIIMQGSVALHRKIGMAGAVLGAAMVVMGVVATFLAVRIGFIPPFFPPAVFIVMNLTNIVVFGVLVAAGIGLRHRAEWHKRLMLCATVSILGPGLGRVLPMPSFGAMAPLVMFGVIVLFALAGPVNDLIIRRRIHPAYLWGVAVILVSMALIGPVASSPVGAALLRVAQKT